MVRYTFIESVNWKRSINTHIIAMLIVYIIWVGVTYGIVIIINPDFIIFYKQTLLWRLLLFIPVYIIVIFSYFIFSFIEKQNSSELQQARMEAKVINAEFEALKSQINPHFLFNSLNSVSSLTMTNPNKAQEMIINISDFFRFTLISSKAQFTDLHSELEHALLYLEIEKNRFGKRMQVIENLPEELYNIRIPTLILQPLVENAVKHGVYESSKNICINFTFEDIGDKVKINIENDIDKDNGSAKKGTSTGLKNVSKRLEIAYKDMNLLTTSKSDNRFKVTIWIPKTIFKIV